MRFAIIDSNRVPASPGLTGYCPGCAKPLVAKCGTRRVWHWAHKGERSCDSWWEPETPWHRRWKDEFPTEWQEIIGHDATGEKHVADVRTPHGLVIEFQHSHLDPAEQRARETFHGNLVWVIDCTRLKRDVPRFAKGKEYIQATALNGVLSIHFPDECFPPAWLESSALVVFDFEGEPAEGEDVDQNAKLWCLLPGRADGRALLGSLPRREFVRLAREQSQVVKSREIIEALDNYYRQAREIEAQQARVRYAMSQRRAYFPRRTRHF